MLIYQDDTPGSKSTVDFSNPEEVGYFIVEVYQAKYESAVDDDEDVECITPEMKHKFSFGKCVSKQDDEEYGLHHFVS